MMSGHLCACDDLRGDVYVHMYNINRSGGLWPIVVKLFCKITCNTVGEAPTLILADCTV